MCKVLIIFTSVHICFLPRVNNGNIRWEEHVSQYILKALDFMANGSVHKIIWGEGFYFSFRSKFRNLYINIPPYDNNNVTIA